MFHAQFNEAGRPPILHFSRPDKDTTHGRNQTFTYAALNRLTSAENAGTNCAAMVLQNKTEYWGNSYGYDAWGNLLQKTITKCGAENLVVTADAHNWLHASGTDYQYDAAGNMTYDAPASLSYTFDQENRLTGAAGYTYTYDADGNRVRKSNGNLAANGTLYWYMMPGVVAESDLAGTTQSEYIFFDGERVARRDGANGAGGVFYYFSDHLKTASVITDSAGVIKDESDYYPWGGELQFVNNDSNDYKFTGKKRDLETGLDYFGARYYSNGLGRWVSADWSSTPVPVPYADLTDPQTLNLYGYVRGLPTTKADVDGHGFLRKLWNYVKDEDGCFCEDKENAEHHAKKRSETIEHDRQFFREHKVYRPDGTRVDGDKLSDQQILDEAQALLRAAWSDNLSVVPAGRMENHHLLPQEFRKQFESAGLDIDSEEFTRKLPESSHRLKPDGLHTGSGRGGDWNQAWRNFFAKYQNPTKEQILQQLDSMMRQFGLK